MGTSPPSPLTKHLQRHPEESITAFYSLLTSIYCFYHIIITFPPFYRFYTASLPLLTDCRCLVPPEGAVGLDLRIAADGDVAVREPLDEEALRRRRAGPSRRPRLE